MTQLWLLLESLNAFYFEYSVSDRFFKIIWAKIVTVLWKIGSSFQSKRNMGANIFDKGSSSGIKVMKNHFRKEESLEEEEDIQEREAYNIFFKKKKGWVTLKKVVIYY